MRIAALFALPMILLGAQPAAPQAPTVVNIQLANFSFTPKSIILDHGHSYVLRLANVADGGHDFTAPEFFAASAITADDRRLIEDGEVEVPPGQVREIHLTTPGAAGKYHLKCSHSFHKMFGMSGSIIVR
jgi:uncharacterized cupredoxin-like copper-binding protein